MNSPRYEPAGLLVEHGKTAVMFDGGQGATPGRNIDAWLVTDEQSELASGIRRSAREYGVMPAAQDLELAGLRIARRLVVHTNHPAYVYRIEVAQGSVVWAPEFLEFPDWAAGAALMFAEAAGWDRTIWFRGRVGGHMPAVDVAAEARRHRVGRLVLAHIGRPTIRAIDRGERPAFGEFGQDGDLYVLDRTATVRRFRTHPATQRAPDQEIPTR